MQISHICHTLGTAFRRCVTRFPLTVLFVLALTTFLLYIIAIESKEDNTLFNTLGYYLSVGTVLSLSLHLWAEEVHKAWLRYGVQVAAQVLLAADALFLYHGTTEPQVVDIIIAHGAGVLAIGISVFFLPFFREKDDIPSWNFAQYAISTLALAVIVGAVMSGGLCLLTFSLHQLFGLHIDQKCYLYVIIICSVLLPLLMFLGLLPEGQHKYDRRPHPTTFLRNIIRYLFLPLAGLYLVVLYAYAATIIARWELPNGWVSWLVTALMTGCIAIELGLYPSRIKYNKTPDNHIARWLPLLTLPLLILMSVGIARRFMDYGITINRLYLATLNVWFYFVCIGLVAGRARRISWIPISFSIVFLATSVLPVNYASITRHTLRNEIKDALTRDGLRQLPLSDTQYEAWLKSLPKGGRQINEKLYYLSSWFGAESIADLVSKDISFYAVREEQSTDLQNLHYHSDIQNLQVPEGYALITSVKLNQQLYGEKTDKYVTITLPEDDILRLPTDTLMTLGKDETLPPPSLYTDTGNVLLLSSFHLYENIEGRQIVIEGLLFHNKQICNK